MKKPILFAIIGLVVVIIVGVVLFLFVFNKKAPSEKPVEYLEYALGESYTNLKGENKILKFSLIIQYTDKEFVAEFNKNKTKLTNNIIQYFRTKTVEQLNATNGQERAREDLLEIIIETLESDTETITDVFFNAFIIQG